MTVQDMNDSRAHDGSRLAVLAIAQFMVVLDVTIVNVALPAIQTDLGFSADGLQWVVNGYTLAFGGLLLLGGRASDLLGRRRLFLAGLALFGVASLAGGFADSSEDADRGPRDPGHRRRAALARRARAADRHVPRRP